MNKNSKEEAHNQDGQGKITSGKHISYWIDSVTAASRKSLDKNLETDVVIVGGGMGGVSVAYCLSQAGKKVVVIEDGFIGSGETGRTTAHLVTAFDDRYYKLEEIFGKEDVKLIAESHRAAIDFVESTVKKENIDCGFERVTGYLFLHPTDKEDSLKREFEATKRAGIDVTELDQVPGMLTKSGKCIVFPSQAEFHPMKYLMGLCSSIEAKGGKIFTETHASEINGDGIRTDKGFTVKAKHVVIATNSPVNSKYTMPLKQDAYRTYVIGALVKKGALPKALWWDTGDQESKNIVPPYHYVRLHSYNDIYDLVISGGEDHPVGETGDKLTDHFAILKEWTRKNFPIEKIVYRWSGQVMEPMDSLAFIGRNPLDKSNVYIITGDSGNGMTHCTIAGLLITDLITGKDNPWEKIYKPSRFTLGESGPFFRKLKDDFMSTIKSVMEMNNGHEMSSVKKGEGKIIEVQNKKMGVFRDEEEHLHIVSAKCMHLGCTVGWNNEEHTWDCPCHGSRYTYEGKVINGPANMDLPAYSEERVHITT